MNSAAFATAEGQKLGKQLPALTRDQQLMAAIDFSSSCRNCTGHTALIAQADFLRGYSDTCDQAATY